MFLFRYVKCPCNFFSVKRHYNLYFCNNNNNNNNTYRYRVKEGYYRHERHHVVFIGICKQITKKATVQ